jgi:hypothetical protein
MAGLEWDWPLAVVHKQKVKCTTAGTGQLVFLYGRPSVDVRALWPRFVARPRDIAYLPKNWCFMALDEFLCD